MSTECSYAHSPTGNGVSLPGFLLFFAMNVTPGVRSDNSSVCLVRGDALFFPFRLTCCSLSPSSPSCSSAQPKKEKKRKKEKKVALGIRCPTQSSSSFNFHNVLCTSSTSLHSPNSSSAFPERCFFLLTGVETTKS